MKSVSCSVVTSAAIIIVPLLTAGQAHAQRWELQPELKLGGEYDDNASLAEDSAFIQEVEGVLFEGALNIGYATERTTFNLRPRVISRNYDEVPDIDSDDFFVNFNWRHRTIKSQFDLRGNFAQESIRTAERADPILDQDDPNAIPDDDTSIVFTKDDRDRLLLAPSFTYDFSERTSFAIRGEYLDVSYDDLISSFLVDYSDLRVEAGFIRRLTERTSGFFGVGARQFDNESSDQDYDGVGAAIGLETRLSETTRLIGEIGYEEAELTSTGESDSIAVANFSVVRTLETVTFLAQYSRSIAPGGIGRVSERDSLNFNVRKSFSERVSAGIGLRSSRSENVVTTTNPGANTDSRDYLQLRAQLEVALSRNLSVEANYRYSDIDRGEGGGSADSNSFVLWLVWRPNPTVL